MAFRKPLDLTDSRGVSLHDDSNVGLGLGLGCSFTTLCPMEHSSSMGDINSMVNMNRDHSMMNLSRESGMMHMMREGNRPSMMDMIRDNHNILDVNRDNNSSTMHMSRDHTGVMNMNTIRDTIMVNTNRDSMVNMTNRDHGMVPSDTSVVHIGGDNNSGNTIMIKYDKDQIMTNLNNMVGLQVPPMPQELVIASKQASPVDMPPKASSKNQGRPKPVGNKNNYSEQSQQIVLNVYKYEYRKKLKGAIARTARSTGIHRLTISKIVKAGVPKTPKKPGSKKKRYAKLDNFMRDDIRQIIHAFYKDGQPPTIEMVYQKLNQKDAKFPYGKSHLRNIIKSLGFKHSRVNKRTVIMESPSGDINSFVLELKGAT